MNKGLKRQARKNAQKKKALKNRKNGGKGRLVSLSLMGIFVTTTLLTAAYLMTKQDKRRTTYQSAKAALHQTMKRPARSTPKTPKPKSQYTVEEEAPDEEKFGFGLEHLIRKLHHKKSPTGKRPATPELAFIIDDVSQKRQLDAIRSIPFPVTPSIFPPSRMNPDSPRLARGLRHYMIHLPMQSGSAKMNRFRKTMMVHDDAGTIRARIDEIRRLFPNARYINNHTGSVFTSDARAMAIAYDEMRKQGFVFLDSKTTGRSSVRKIVRRYGDPYLSRDVFLDNVQQRSYIRKQLMRAVRIAKKRGYAIAIGHPHPVTLRTLRNAADLLKGVRPVYFDDFYREHYGR